MSDTPARSNCASDGMPYAPYPSTSIGCRPSRAHAFRFQQTETGIRFPSRLGAHARADSNSSGSYPITGCTLRTACAPVARSTSITVRGVTIEV